MITSTSSPLLQPPTDPRWPAPVRITLGLVGFMALLLGVGVGVSLLLGQVLGLPPLVTQVVSSFAFAGSVVALVTGLARLERRGGRAERPLAQLGLRWSAHGARSLLVAVLAVMVAMVLVGVITRLTGFAGAAQGLEQFSLGQLLGAFAFALVPAFVMQGFPEELFFRGYVLNAPRVPVPLTVGISSVLFGSIHVLSQSPASGGFEKFVLYPLMAIALGFACALARLATGSLWAAVGIHGGMHMGIQVVSLFAAPEQYGGFLVAQTLLLAAVGLVLWAGRSRLGRRDDRTAAVEECSTVAA